MLVDDVIRGELMPRLVDDRPRVVDYIILIGLDVSIGSSDDVVIVIFVSIVIDAPRNTVCSLFVGGVGYLITGRWC